MRILRAVFPALLLLLVAALALFTSSDHGGPLLAVNMLAPASMIGVDYYAEDGTKTRIPPSGLLSIASGMITSALKAGFTLLNTANDALTALAGGAQVGATALTAGINRVTTVASAADSVILPLATPGLEVVVINAAAANAMNVFPAVGDLINALSANTAISVVANKTMRFHCAVAGKWNTILTA